MNLVSNIGLLAGLLSVLFHLANGAEMFNFESPQVVCLENIGTCQVPVLRSGDMTAETVIECWTSGVTAQANSDYTGVSDDITFLSGDDMEVCDLPITNDETFEGSETLKLRLYTMNQASLITEIEVTIIDNEVVALSLVVDSSTATEGDPIPFQVELQEPDEGFDIDVSFTLSLTAGTATPADDYQALTQSSYTFPAGDSTPLMLEVLTVDNMVCEDDETFLLQISATTLGAIVTPPNAVQLTIEDDDPVSCEDGLSGCHENAFCDISGCLKTCTCLPGYVGDGESCEEVPILQCSEVTIISLNNETLAELGVEVGDHVVISPDRLDYADDVADECIQPLSDPVVFKIDVPDCSPTVEEDDYHINFTYVIRNQPAKDRSSPIQRFEDYCLELTCSFDKTTNLTQGAIIPSIRKTQLDSVSVSSEFDLDLNFFTNSSYDVILEELAVVVPDDVFVGVELETSSEDDFVVQLHYCYATSTSNRNGVPIYDLILDSCAADAAVVVDRNYEAASAEFKFQSFVWTGISDDEQEIFVHCEVTICFNSSDPACTTNECPPMRRRRDLVDDNHRQLVTSQPITILTTRKPSCQQNNGGCSDGCYMEDGEAMCYCFEGRQLESDSKVCREVPQVIVLNKEEAMTAEERSFPSEQQVLLIAVVALVVGFIVAVCITRRKKTTLPIAF